MNLIYDVVIVGAGAAGLMCAISAGRRGRRVLLLDHNKKIGDKIRISGGGRCNFTNLNIAKENYLGKNPYFCLSALNNFSNQDFISLVKDYKINFHEKTLGQLFCDGSSKEIIAMLLDECTKNNVTILTETTVNNVSKNGDSFVITTNEKSFSSESLVVATGGLSIPKMGASDFGYKIAKQFELDIIKPEPALVPFTLDTKLLQKTKDLSGVSVPKTIISCNKQNFQEALLFTHKGLSGPAILQISSYWKQGDVITVNLLPDYNMFEELKAARKDKGKQDISTILANYLPKKLAIFLSAEHNCTGHIADMNNQKLEALANHINNWEIIPNGTEGFAKAEVTRGGINTDQINQKTFCSKKIEGLYFIGEVLDITGHLGGYNFQWAWSSGYSAGQYC